MPPGQLMPPSLVIFECDLKIVAEAVNGSCEPPITIHNKVEGIQLKLKDFRKVQVSHIRRQGNRPAHILVQSTRNLVSFVAWIEENPIVIELVLAQDVMCLSSS